MLRKNTKNKDTTRDFSSRTRTRTRVSRRERTLFATKDEDKDLNSKDQNRDQDFKFVLKDSLRTRTLSFSVSFTFIVTFAKVRVIKSGRFEQSAMMKTDAGTCASLSVSLLTTSSRLSNHFLLYTPIDLRFWLYQQSNQTSHSDQPKIYPTVFLNSTIELTSTT